jgi:transcriptional antiterminator RfaH
MQMESTDISLASNPWYAIYCRPGRESFAARMLHTQLGLPIYLPEMEISLQKGIQRVPFFPGYFFLQANLQKVGLSCINSSPGVLKLLDFGDGPLVIPETFIEMIREQTKKRDMRSDLALQKLLRGDSVRVTRGPLEGLQAVFLESLTAGERARIFLRFLGRFCNVQVNTSDLEKIENTDVGSPLPSHRQRLTRGKGRKIKQIQVFS